MKNRDMKGGKSSVILHPKSEIKSLEAHQVKFIEIFFKSLNSQLSRKLEIM